MIKGNNLSYIYEGVETNHQALDGVDFNVSRGDFVAVLGHNGSGKSTLAKLLNGILLPSSGVLYVSDIDTSNEEQIWDIRRVAGMVFQNPDNQIVATIVEEDIAFGPENLGLPSDEIIRRVEVALETVEMTEYRKKPPHLLSGGQKQRIAIAGILAMKPECIILDEPTAMLDPVGRKEVIDTILRLNKEENITIILITHFMEEAVLADIVHVMSEGKIVKSGTPREIFSQVKELNDLRLDVPLPTIIANKLKSKGIEIDGDILTINELVNRLCQLL